MKTSPLSKPINVGPFLLFAGYAMLGAIPAASAVPVRSMTFEQMVAICKLPANSAGHAIAALPDNLANATLLVCMGYDRGQEDLLRQLRGTPGKRRAI
jgi:hypothetical protein